MPFRYYKQALDTLKREFRLDGVKDVILHRKDKIICYAVHKDNTDLELHILSGSFSQLDYEDSPTIMLSQLFADMDLENMYAKVGGKQEYYDAVVSEIMDFSSESNTTFPIKPKKERIWIRLTSDLVSKKDNLFAIHITIVTPYISQEEELFYKTHHDSLTGLLNKYTFDSHYGARYRNDSFHVMFLDLDDFKLVNDILGHRVGNDYLRGFAKILLSHEDDHSRFYRLGGDEFVGLLFYDESTIKAIADDIILKTQKLSRDTSDVTTSVTIGIVQATKREDVVRKADKLMYQAKKEGKNKYIFKQEE